MALQKPVPAKKPGGVSERVDEILGSVVNEDALLRRGAVTRLAEIGPDAVPRLQEKIRSGSAHVARTAAIALGEIGDLTAGGGRSKYLRDRKLGDQVDVGVVAAYALGACPGAPAAETLLAIAERENENDHVRIAAALGLARRPDRPLERLGTVYAALAKQPDAEPEVFGALTLAFARTEPAEIGKRAPALLKESHDPAVRAAVLLGLALARRPAALAGAAPDLKSSDPILARCAILGTGEPPKKNDTSPLEQREARVAALGLGAGGADLLALAREEREVTIRPIWYGAAAA